jgi:uncharacterized protein with ParB-like and HNH nuclease domain
MQFNDILIYLEKMIGLELQPINASNEPLIILSIDREKRRYTLDKTSSTGKRNRSFIELNKIWDVLSQKGFASVDQALGGSGTSRHQPETIFANIPCIEHFKYEKKKHLYLRDESTHILGTIKTLSTSESKEIKKRIDRYRDFDISQFYSLHSLQINMLKDKLTNIFTKYPGESDVAAINSIFNEIKELDLKLSEAVVNIDNSSSTSIALAEDDSINGEISENENEDEDEDEDERYKTATITGLQPTRISQVTPTVSLVFDRVNYKEIDLQPEFQRGDRIWPDKDKARLIESVLLRLPLPVFYFAERPNSDPDTDNDFDWVVIDGLQRITALVGFMKGDFFLKDLKLLPKYNGLVYKDLPRKEQRKIREYQIHGHLIQISQDSDEMIRELFHRINTYGKNLSFQEIRSALYPGSANRFFKYFSEESAFIDAIPTKINPNRMLDLEYVLKAVASLILGYEKYSYKTADDYLCHAMQVLNKYRYVVGQPISKSDPIYIDIDYRLKVAFEAISTIFGNDAYKKEKGGKINKTLFELLVSLFGLMTDEEREIVLCENNAIQIKLRLFEMIKNDEHSSEWSSETYALQGRGFDYSISNSTSKKVTVLYRFRSIVNMINEVTKMNFKPQPLLESENKKEDKK